MRYIERFQNTSQKHQVFKKQDNLMAPEKKQDHKSQGPKPEFQGQRFSVKGQIQTQSVEVRDWNKQCSRDPQPTCSSKSK